MLKFSHIDDISYYVNKSRLEFYSSNFTRVDLRKDVCAFFAFLISKSVSQAIFGVQLVYFIRKLVILTLLDGRVILFLRIAKIAKIEKIARSLSDLIGFKSSIFKNLTERSHGLGNIKQVWI